MPRVSQNHDGSPKRRLQPIFLLDEPLGIRMVELDPSCRMSSRVLMHFHTPVGSYYVYLG